MPAVESIENYFILQKPSQIVDIWPNLDRQEWIIRTSPVLTAVN